MSGMVARRFQNPRKRRAWRSKAIRAFVGINGSGKTLGAVWSLLPSLDAGRPVLSTARLLDYRNPRPCGDVGCPYPGHPEHGQAHPMWVPFTDWRQVIGGGGHPVLRDADVLADEAGGILSSRESGSLPFQVSRDLQQLRHRKVTFTYTAPTFARTEKILREVTQLIVHASGFLPERFTDETEVTSWRRNRMSRWRWYDGETFDTFVNSAVTGDAVKKSTAPKPLGAQWFWIPGSPASLAYDSHNFSALSVGWAAETGMCLACGGRRSMPRCTCETQARPVLDLVPSGDAASPDRGEDGPGRHQGSPLDLDSHRHVS